MSSKGSAGRAPHRECSRAGGRCCAEQIAARRDATVEEVFSRLGDAFTQASGGGPQLGAARAPPQGRRQQRQLHDEYENFARSRIADYRWRHSRADQVEEEEGR